MAGAGVALTAGTAGADDELLELLELEELDDEELLELRLAVTSVGTAAVAETGAEAGARAAASDVSASAERADAAEGFPDDEVVGPASPSCVATTSTLSFFCSLLAGRGTWAAYVTFSRRNPMWCLLAGAICGGLAASVGWH